jgi:uncharacterized protein YndB with AHSA1/START domain
MHMNSNNVDGMLERVADGWRLVFTRRLAHPSEKVWRAIVEAEHRDAWFPQRIEGEWRVGAPLRFVSESGGFEGEVLAFEPPRLVEMRWGTDRIRLEVQPDGDGCVLTLSDTFAEQGKAARDAAGWHACLDGLESELAGERAGWTVGERWQAVHGAYVERFGPAGATIGPPEGAPPRS